MKYLLTILFLCISGFYFSQDTLHIPSVELDEFFLALDTLEVQDSIKTILIEQLENEIIFYDRLTTQDSLIISYKNQEIVLLNEQIKLHLDHLNQVDKWYKKPWVGFTGGFLGTLLLIHTIDYTLPE
jgi:hypothetical protein|tara:strand:- start:42 stop:422 length:381 start_codon:yes stop_codon:yes gene_type:complete